MSFQVEGSDDAVSIFRSSLAHLKRALRLKEDRKINAGALPGPYGRRRPSQ
jgi:hypothetical protein